MSTDITASTRDETEPFRFMELPGELRNKVYALLLCSFDPEAKKHENTFDSSSIDSCLLAQIKDKVNAAILQTSSQIHREAYDIMVKRNQFILLSSKGGIPLRAMLASQYIPVIALNKQIAHFKGYVILSMLSAVSC
jgi:hypothetical protein